MRKLWGIVVLGLAMACGGGGSKATRPSGGNDATPSWLAEGTGAVRSDGTRRIQGVGVASGVGDIKKRRRAADAAARDQLQSSVDSFAQALAKMSESTQASAGTDVTAIARRAASQVASIRDHWVTPDGDERALGVVDLDAFKKALQGVDGDEKVKREMAANADRAFDQLAGK
jgi:hypothetical protein